MRVFDLDGLEASLELGIQEDKLLKLFLEYSGVLILLDNRVCSANDESMSDWASVFVKFIVVIKPNEITVVRNLFTLDFLQVSGATLILNWNLQLRQQEINFGALVSAVFRKLSHIFATSVILNYTVNILLNEHLDCTLLEHRINVLREIWLEIFAELSTKNIYRYHDVYIFLGFAHKKW